MKSTTIYSILMFLNVVFVEAQVGINTNTPNPGATLDVNGRTNVTERIYLQGTDVAMGNPGNNKQPLVSKGSVNKPNWESKKLPPGYASSFTMTYMNSFFDETGLGNSDLPASGTGVYTPNELIGTDWKVISGLTNDFVLYKPGSKVNVMFQTVAQLTSSSSTSVSFACGLFIAPGKKDVAVASDFRLKGVRNDVVQGISGSYKTVNLTSTLDGAVDNIPGSALGTWYTAKVACRARNRSASLLFGIGTPVDNTVLNQQMASSSLNIFVLEKW